MKEVKKEEEKVSTGVSIDDAFNANKDKPVENVVDQDKITFKKIFLHSPKKYLVSLVIMVVLIISSLSMKGFNLLVNYCNAFFIAAALFIGIGFLSILTNLGTFDVFSYSGKYVANRIRNVNIEKYPEYTENKKEKRKKFRFNFVPYMVLGLIGLIVAIILQIILGQI